MNRKAESTWLHRRRLERIVEKDRRRAARTKRRDDREGRKRDKWSKRFAALAERRALLATIGTIVLSVSVAIPAQLEWFLGKLAGGHWLFPGALVAVVATLLIEGLCWLGAFLYADSVNTTPVRLYRLTTLVFASLAAAINYTHGNTISPAVGVVYALASLMGVGAWELYMHRTRHIASGMTAEEIKLWALRWRRHYRVMRECGRIRATFGTVVPLETAWQMAYVRRHGNPTVPVAVTDDVLARIFASTNERIEESVETGGGETPAIEEAEPAGDTDGRAAVATADVIELPVGWDSINTVEKVLERFWPDTPGTNTAPAVTDPPPPSKPKPTAKRDRPSRTTTARRPKHAAKNTSLREQGLAWFTTEVANGRDPETITGAEVDRAIGAAPGYCKKHVKTWAAAAANPERPPT